MIDPSRGLPTDILRDVTLDVSALVERLELMCAEVSPPMAAPDMVHSDLNPSNVLVRDGKVVAVVDRQRRERHPGD